MELAPAIGLAAGAPHAAPPAYQFGDESRVEVEVVLDNKPVGGFQKQ